MKYNLSRLATRLWHNAIGIRNAPKDIEERVISAGYEHKPAHTGMGWEFYQRENVEDLDDSICGIRSRNSEPIEVRLFYCPDRQDLAKTRTAVREHTEFTKPGLFRENMGRFGTIFYGYGLVEAYISFVQSSPDIEELKGFGAICTIAIAAVGLAINTTKKLIDLSYNITANGVLDLNTGCSLKGKKAEKALKEAPACREIEFQNALEKQNV